VDKDSTRRKLLEQLSLLSRHEILSLSLGVTKQLIKLFHAIPELTGEIGAGFLPLTAEIAPVYQELFRAVPLNVSYPVLIDAGMKFGLPQGLPKGSAWLDGPYHLVTPEWIFVPGVGFDLSGARLGRGKGFYDRYLEESEALRIGLAWSGQVLDKIPSESHDCQMDYIITEKFCWDVEQQKSF
jgi:5-formyltetrahydrofolate cyclo-ligase